tara:strand:- start:4278 stop:5123 length:846 start_codon:yes stop_codon:yes gene_type:complete
MAVKPITNPNPTPPSKLDRSKQISNKDLNVRSISNKETVVVPGKDATKNFHVVLKDLDTAILSHIQNVMRIKVRENGEMVDVPIMYANQERWANIKRNGVIRDKNGSLLLPLMSFRRVNVEFNDELPSYKQDVTGDFVQVVRTSGWSKANQYDAFGVQTGIKPIKENIVTGVPQYVNATYDFIVYSSFITQMNTIVESFVQQHQTYWGDNTSYRFHCLVEGGMADATEMDVAGERIVKTTFSVMLKGYLLPEVIANVIQSKRFSARKNIVGGKIVFGEKIV